MLSHRWLRPALLGTPIILSMAACGGPSRAAPPPEAPAATARTTSAVPIGGCQAPGSGEELRTTDTNGDGSPEVCKYYRDVADPERPGQNRTLLVRQDLDLNWDNKTDITREFGPDGNVVKESWDTDYDGRIDEVRTFEEGTIVRAERDQDNDGRFEIVRIYEDGKLVRKEIDSNGDGKPDRWEYFEGKTVDRVGIDRDFDGKPDSWTKASNQPG